MTILVTGGAGFIGSNFILDWLSSGGESVVNLDCLTYAGNVSNLSAVADDSRYHFVRGSIADQALISRLLTDRGVRAIIHFAAESHVDRSISGPAPFIETNVVGTSLLLAAAREYFETLDVAARQVFRFVHVSTDEVYGTLDAAAPGFTEDHPYRPNSPYAASKAASDHLVRAYRETYGLPAVITNCSNNYGRFQFPEKLIPLVIHNALGGKMIPIYGDGEQIRDWLFVADHCAAIRRVLDAGQVGETYNVGGESERTNIEVVLRVCTELDRKRPRLDGSSYAEQIRHVRDRPGHDRRYAVDGSKIRRELGWAPVESFETGIARTVDWYLENQAWVDDVTSGAYRDWVERQYA